MTDSLVTDLMSDKYERSVCEDPFCGCIVLYLKKRETPDVEIKLDCMRRQVTDLSGDCQLTESDIVGSLSGNDWDTLLNEFTHLKWAMTIKCPDEYLVSDQFNFYSIYENGLQVPVHEIFPAVGGFPRTCNGRRVIILDSFCIRSGCSCGEAGLELLELDEHGDNPKPFAAVNLDLKKMRWTRDPDYPAESNLPYRQIVEDFLAEPGCQKLLRARQALLHETYMRSRDSFSAAPIAPVKADVKPGRNEPCPCGSGKKYKKCCARK